MSIEERARKIRIFCTDVDGVLTSGHVLYTIDGGDHLKAFNTKDGSAVKWLKRSGIETAFISGRSTKSTGARANDLGVTEVYLGSLDKWPIVETLMTKYGLKADEVAYFGDDLHDAPVLRRVGLACCPADAVREVRSICHYVSPFNAGMGVFRDVAEIVLKSQQKWDGIVAEYLGDGRPAP